MFSIATDELTAAPFQTNGRLRRAKTLWCAGLTAAFMLQLLPALAWTAEPFTNELSLAEVEELALKNYARLEELGLQASAMEEMSISESQLADPELVLGAQNFPTDTFRLDQEPMTQLRVGLRQKFPQGDTLELKGDKLQVKADTLRSMSDAEALMAKRRARKLWLEISYLQSAAGILEQDRGLFKQLLTVTRSLYGVGKAQQQDVLRAELELSRLAQQLIGIKGRESAQRAMLARWIGHAALNAAWPAARPELEVPDALSSNLPAALARHPRLRMLQQRIDEADVDVAIAQEQYSPGFGVELSYGLRAGEGADRNDRPDFLSAVVTMSLPIFTAQRQDKSLQSARYQSAASDSAWRDGLQALTAEAAALRSQLEQTDSELALYDQSILKQAHLEARSTLNAYQAAAALFSEVMRAYINEQRDRLRYERLKVRRLQLISELQYFLPSSSIDAGVPAQ